MTALSPTGWQAGFLQILPTVETHAKFRFRRLPPERREDAIQEAIAAACVSYQLLAAQGKLHVACPGTLARFALQHVRSGRHVGGSQDAARDAMSPACQRRHGVQVGPLDAPRQGQSRWQQIAAANSRWSVADAAAFRIDFGAWLRMLSRRNRKIVASFIRGDGTRIVAERLGVSEGRVSQLRRKYEAAWRAFQGETLDERSAA